MLQWCIVLLTSTFYRNHAIVSRSARVLSSSWILADIIALCGNYKNQGDFSFLQKNKFRDGKHAKNFEAAITWESNITNAKNLDDLSDNGDIELVKYLPQKIFYYSY